jgi:hypothetical protein
MANAAASMIRLCACASGLMTAAVSAHRTELGACCTMQQQPCRGRRHRARRSECRRAPAMHRRNIVYISLGSVRPIHCANSQKQTCRALRYHSCQQCVGYPASCRKLSTIVEDVVVGRFGSQIRVAFSGENAFQPFRSKFNDHTRLESVRS